MTSFRWSVCRAAAKPVSVTNSVSSNVCESAAAAGSERTLQIALMSAWLKTPRHIC